MATLNPHLKKLTKGEKAAIVNVVIAFSSFKECHLGVLPFLEVEKVATALRAAMIMGNKPRFYAKILNKLEGISGEHYFQRITLRLSDKKIYKRFGANTSLGIVIPGLSKVETTAGVSFNIGKRDYVPHKVRVPRKVTLMRLGTNRWSLFASHEIEKATLWLLDNCGV